LTAEIRHAARRYHANGAHGWDAHRANSTGTPNRALTMWASMPRPAF